MRGLSGEFRAFDYANIVVTETCGEPQARLLPERACIARVDGGGKLGSKKARGIKQRWIHRITISRGGLRNGAFTAMPKRFQGFDRVKLQGGFNFRPAIRRARARGSDPPVEEPTPQSDLTALVRRFGQPIPTSIHQ